MCTGTNNTSAFVCTCANTWDGNGAHTGSGLFPAPHTAPAGRWHHFSTLASHCSFPLIPRDLLFPLICLLSVLERKVYTAQHTPGTWSHSKLWVLIPSPLVSPPGACGCGGVCTDMHLSLWHPSTGCLPWPALDKKGTGSWLKLAPELSCQHQLPLVSPETIYYIFTLSTSAVNLAVQRPSFPGAPILLTVGGHSLLELACWSTGKEKLFFKTCLFFFFLCPLPADSWNILKNSSWAKILSTFEKTGSKRQIKLLKQPQWF